MVWKTTSFESVALNDGLLHEIYITDREKVKLPPDKARRDKTEVVKVSGIERNRGPVAFLATDSLSEQIKTIPGVYQIHWKGKRPLKDGRTFNVFTVALWEGNLPAWASDPAGRDHEEPGLDEIPL